MDEAGFRFHRNYEERLHLRDGRLMVTFSIQAPAPEKRRLLSSSLRRALFCARVCRANAL